MRVQAFLYARTSPLEHVMSNTLSSTVRQLALFCALLACAATGTAQTYYPPPPPGTAPPSSVAPAFSQQELDQLLAPVALYPDALLSQILMASTYPLEVVEAARWSRAYPGLQGDAAVRAVESMNWDPSVKSLVAFPQILILMDERLDWTQRLGDAFLADESRVMDTVQELRHRAYAAGNLRTDERVHVLVHGPSILIEPAVVTIMYVPYYDPRYVYGSWWWPTYPPVYWAPWPGYYARPGVSFGYVWSSGIRLSVGFFFGAFDWRERHVRVVSVNNYYYRPPADARRAAPHVLAAPGVWQHDPEHRRGVRYPEPSTRERFSAAQPEASRSPRVEPRVDARPEARMAPAPAPRVEAPVARPEARRYETAPPSHVQPVAPAPRVEARPEPPRVDNSPQIARTPPATPPQQRQLRPNPPPPQNPEPHERHDQGAQDRGHAAPQGGEREGGRGERQR
jgi:hypothetical protein